MKPVLRPSLEHTRVWLYRDPVDFRKSHRGLAALVELELERNPFDGALYAFTNRQRNKIKCLLWENNGFVLVRPEVALLSVKRRKDGTI